MERTNGWRAEAVRLLIAGAVVGGLGGCARATPAAELYPELVEFAGREIEDVRFDAPGVFPEDTLEAIVETAPSRCELLGLPICIPFTGLGERDEHVSLERLRRDAVRLALFYRRSGFFGTRVSPDVAEEDDGDVVVTFEVALGDAVVLDTLVVEGTEGILDPDSLAARLPLRPGERFSLYRLDEAADRILRALLSRGYAYAEVLRNYAADTITDVADARLTAIPGPRVVVDSIVVLGANELGRGATLRQLTFEEGEVLVREELVESQRNLYTLELVQIATVALAPESLQAAPGDSTRATVVVRVSEGPVHVVEAQVGFGTVDCFLTRAEWVSRSFLGGARRLSVTAGLSKIGIGSPLDLGLGGSICGAYEGDPFRDDLDYELAANLTQPAFLDPRNRLTFRVHAERQSEPNVFQRVVRGGRVALARRLDPREEVTGVLEVERGRTVSTPAVFCVALQVCQPEDIRQIQESRWRNLLGATWVRDRTNLVVAPTDGSRLQLGLGWAAAWLGSDVDFVRGTAEGAAYRTVRPGWVLAGRLQAGSFFGTASVGAPGEFLPPEERFFAGGPNTVRGFGRNLLGPGVYVADSLRTDPATGETVPVRPRFVPVGGTAMVVAGVELRVPSPVFGEFLRLAFFVDAGAVGARREGALAAGALRITPGAGLRLTTPIGPVRLDAAYNPYDPTPGPLFVTRPDGGLVRVADAFAPPAGGFLDRIRFHLAVGQPF